MPGTRSSLIIEHCYADNSLYKLVTVSYLDHIHACNNFDPSGFRPLYIGAARVGFVRPALALTLTRWPAVFRVGEDAVHVHDLTGRVRRVWSLTISNEIDDKGMLLFRTGSII